MDIEAQTQRNTDDISKLTAAVSELALTMRYEIERGKEERDNVKSMVNELRGLNEKMGSLTTMTAELAELKGELGKQRHDIRNLENAQNAIPLLKNIVDESSKKIAVLETKDEGCKEWRDKHDGATRAMSIAVRAMWAVCGTGVLSLGAFVLYLFFTNTSPVLMRKIGSNSYYGQATENAQGN